MTKNLLTLHSLDTLLEMNMKKHKMKRMTTSEVRKFMKKITSNEIIHEITEKEYIKIIKKEPEHYNRYQHSAYFVWDTDDARYRYYKRLYKNQRSLENVKNHKN